MHSEPHSNKTVLVKLITQERQTDNAVGMGSINKNSPVTDIWLISLQKIGINSI